jgi:hypothetical protein
VDFDRYCTEIFYRRRTVDGLEVSGDRGWLDFWLGHVAFA